MTNDINAFKRVHPSGDCGMSNVEIINLLDKWREDNQRLKGHEFGYQLALYIAKYKSNISTLEKA